MTRQGDPAALLNSHRHTARLSKDFQIRDFDGELCQMADTRLAVKPTRAAIAT
jgi:hypothetical protein